MRIREKKTGAVAEVNESFGMRMIEQGKAVLIPEKAESIAVKPKRRAKEEPQPEEDASDDA